MKGGLFKKLANTITNVTRESDQYGNVHFISLYGTILSRLAYFNDNKFLTNYCKIVGTVVPYSILKSINSVSTNDLQKLLNDQELYELSNSKKPLSSYTYEFGGKKYIAFNALNIPQNVNIINEEKNGTVKTVVQEFSAPSRIIPPADVKYISIGWSSYGEIFVVADKRMPNMIFVIFRGTYSPKTAYLYTKPTSLVPLSIGCGEEKFLYGIFKPTVSLIHTLIESIRYLASDFLKATKPNSVKVFTTGHSLGAAMCTNFAYLWVGIRKTAPYTDAPYNILSDNIICVSVGAPKSMNKLVAQKFCGFVQEGKIVYLRITSRGDVVTGLPPFKSSGYEHPCSHDKKLREKVYENCNAKLSVISGNYDGPLDCQNYTPRVYAPNLLSTGIYLDILFIKAVDIEKFINLKDKFNI